MNHQQLLNELLEVQKLLIKCSKSFEYHVDKNNLIYGKCRNDCALELEHLQKNKQHSFHFIIPTGKFLSLRKPPLQLISQDNIIGDFCNLQLIKKNYNSIVNNDNLEDKISIALLRILGLLRYYGSHLIVENYTDSYNLELELEPYRQLAEELCLNRKLPTSCKLRQILDPFQKGDDNITHLSVVEHGEDIIAWKRFKSFSKQQQQNIAERCNIETFGDIKKDQFVGFRSVSTKQSEVTKQVEQQNENSKSVQKNKTILDSLNEEIIKAQQNNDQETQDPEKLKKLINKQIMLYWVLELMGDKNNQLINVTEDTSLPKDISFAKMFTHLSNCKYELQRLGIELHLNLTPPQISFYRDEVIEKFRNIPDGKWLLEETADFYQQQNSEDNYGYFDVQLSEHPKLVQALVTDERLSQYIQQQYPGVICYYIIQTVDEIEKDIFPSFFRIGDKITATISDGSLTRYINSLQDNAQNMEGAEEYVLTGLLQFDWVKEFFYKVKELRNSGKQMGFESNPNIVHLIKSQALVKKLIEKRCNILFLSIDDNFELSKDEAISFSVRDKETRMLMGSYKLHFNNKEQLSLERQTRKFKKLINNDKFISLIKQLRISLKQIGDCYFVEDSQNKELLFHNAIDKNALQFLQNYCQCNWPEADRNYQLSKQEKVCYQQQNKK